MATAPTADAPTADAPAGAPRAPAGNALPPPPPRELRWDERHCFNAEGVYCYCGQNRTYGEVALQCSACEQWFHGRCVRAKGVERMVPLQRNYAFTCRGCARAAAATAGADASAAEESLELVETSWRTIAETALLNLALSADGRGFRVCEGGARTEPVCVKEELIPWVRAHFGSLGHGRELSKMLDAKQPALDKVIFHPNGSDVFAWTERTHVSVRRPEAQPVAPLLSRAKQFERQRAAQAALLAAAGGGGEGAPGADEAGGGAVAAGAKRQLSGGGGGGGGGNPPPKKGRRVGAGSSEPKGARAESRRQRPARAPEPTVPAHLVPENSRMVPVVRCADVGAAQQDGALVQLSLRHRASHLRIARAAGAPPDSGYVVASGHKGYRTVCATHAVAQGTWFYEVTVRADAPPAPHDAGAAPEGHCRVGWATELATPDAPAGYDDHSYSYRSKAGTAFHQSVGRRFGASGYGPGDVVGCLIHLPQSSTLPRQRVQLDLKSGSYLIVDPEHKRTANEGSLLAFYKNGRLQGAPYEGLPREWWYPALSLFGDITLTANFGPHFQCAPTELPAGVSRVQPMSMAAAEAEAEAALPGKGGASAGLPSELTGWQQQQPAAGLAQAPGQAGAAGAGPASQAQRPAAAPAAAPAPAV